MLDTNGDVDRGDQRGGAGARRRPGQRAQGPRRAVGQGRLPREVPLNPLVRQVLDEWLAERTATA